MKRTNKIIGALKIWLVIYPSITFFLFFFGEHLVALPLYVRTFILTITLVPFMVFAGLPVLENIINTAKKLLWR
ncbi:MAG: hypothetical protein V4539_16895 [Bacteroidota bacterium]